MLYDRFSNEAALRTEFIRPLITKMGFLTISELDGPQEFGKDFVFSELTPFGFLRHYAAVVKHKETIRQGAHKLCEEILSQVRQAFSVSFRLPDSSQVNKISSVLVINSGAITPGATTYLRGALDSEKYGNNVHIFEGERLFQMDIQSAFRRNEMVLPRLTGIFSNMQLNLRICESILDSLPSFTEGRGLFTQSLENYVSAPFLTDEIDLQVVCELLQEYRIISTINQRYLNGIFGPSGIREKEVETLREIIPKAALNAKAVLSSVIACYKKIQCIGPAS